MSDTNDKTILIIRNLSGDEKIRQEAYYREKRLHDEATALGHARREGIAQGRAEGRAEGLIQGRAEGLIQGSDQGTMRDKTGDGQKMTQIRYNRGG